MDPRTNTGNIRGFPKRRDSVFLAEELKQVFDPQGDTLKKADSCLPLLRKSGSFGDPHEKNWADKTRGAVHNTEHSSMKAVNHEQREFGKVRSTGNRIPSGI